MSADNTPNTTVGNTLPDAWDWNTDTKTDIPDTQLTAIQPSSNATQGISNYVDVGGPNPKLDPHSIGYITDGVDSFLETHALETLDTPTYYSDIDQHELIHVQSESTFGQDDGTGLTGELLEQGIRFATGGGAYRSDDLTITLCDSHIFIIQYDTDAYAITYQMLRNVGEYRYERETSDLNIRGETNEMVLDGIRRFKSVLAEQFNIQLTGHYHRSSSKHYFTTDSDDGWLVSASGQMLHKFGQRPFGETPTGIVGDQTYEPIGGTQEFEYSVPSIHYQIGDPKYDSGTTKCVWYSESIDRIHTGRVRETTRVKVGVRYWFLTVRIPENRGRDVIRTSVRDSFIEVDDFEWESESGDN